MYSALSRRLWAIYQSPQASEVQAPREQLYELATDPGESRVLPEETEAERYCGFLRQHVIESVALHGTTGGNPVVSPAHEDFAYLPEKTFSWVGQYSFDTDIGSFAARLSGSYKDDVYIGLEAGADVSEFSTLDDYTLWNARLTSPS